jgi:hypothetical protein
MQSKGNYDIIFFTWYNGTLIALYSRQGMNAERPRFNYLETLKNLVNDTFIIKCVTCCSLKILLHAPINA